MVSFIQWKCKISGKSFSRQVFDIRQFQDLWAFKSMGELCPVSLVVRLQYIWGVVVPFYKAKPKRNGNSIFSLVGEGVIVLYLQLAFLVCNQNTTNKILGQMLLIYLVNEKSPPNSALFYSGLNQFKGITNAPFYVTSGQHGALSIPKSFPISIPIMHPFILTVDNVTAKVSQKFRNFRNFRNFLTHISTLDFYILLL